jgi:outer membrane protein assembly factor BamA
MKISGIVLLLAFFCTVAPSQSPSDVSAPVEISFYGNQNFSNDELLENFKSSAGDSWKQYDERAFEYFAQKYTRGLMFSKGFWRAKIIEITSAPRAGKQIVRILVDEGPRFRMGTIKVKGNEAITTKTILEMLGQRQGSAADGKAVQDLLYETLKDKYCDLGFVQYNAEFEPDFVEPGNGNSDGVVNVLITIDEGRQFKLRRLEFVGIESDEAEQLAQSFPLKSGDVYIQSKLEKWANAINETKRFAFLDKDRHVQIRTDEEAADLDLEISLKKLLP